MFFAHEESLHTAETSQLEHTLTNDYILLSALVVLLTIIWTRFGKWRLVSLLGVLLVATFGLYRISPLASGAALTLGFGLALFALVGEGNSKKTK
ncbi:MAG TPA: hypothetical protein VGA08_03340 [Candidatus Saccharimonadales bacterium]